MLSQPRLRRGSSGSGSLMLPPLPSSSSSDDTARCTVPPPSASSACGSLQPPPASSSSSSLPGASAYPPLLHHDNGNNHGGNGNNTDGGNHKQMVSLVSTTGAPPHPLLCPLSPPSSNGNGNGNGGNGNTNTLPAPLLLHADTPALPVGGIHGSTAQLRRRKSPKGTIRSSNRGRKSRNCSNNKACSGGSGGGAFGVPSDMSSMIDNWPSTRLRYWLRITFMTLMVLSLVLVLIALLVGPNIASSVRRHQMDWLAAGTESLAASHVLEQLAEAEAGERGYLLTNATSYLKATQSAMASLPALVNHLANISDSPLADQLVPLLTQRVALMLSSTLMRQQVSTLDTLVNLVTSQEREAERVMAIMKDDTHSIRHHAQERMTQLYQSANDDLMLLQTGSWGIVAGVGMLVFIACGVVMFLDWRLQRQEKKEFDCAMKANKSATQVMAMFLASMSHEIRTPMNGVVAIAEELSTTSLTADQKGMLDIIRSSADAMMRLINDILLFSKIEAAQFSLVPEVFNLRRFLQPIVDTSRVRAQAKGLQFQFLIEDTAPVYLYSDPGRLRQVLLNLIDNAVKFTADGIVQLRVTLNRTIELYDGPGSSQYMANRSASPAAIGNNNNNANASSVPAKRSSPSSSSRRVAVVPTPEGNNAPPHEYRQRSPSDRGAHGHGHGGTAPSIYDSLPMGVIDDIELECLFEVTDTGIGISEEAQSMIFQPFTQAEPNTARDFGGTGLGLTVCSELVKLMGGVLTVQSKLGSGTSFAFIVASPLLDETIAAQSCQQNLTFASPFVSHRSMPPSPPLPSPPAAAAALLSSGVVPSSSITGSINNPSSRLLGGSRDRITTQACGNSSSGSPSLLYPPRPLSDYDDINSTNSNGNNNNNTATGFTSSTMGPPTSSTTSTSMGGNALSSAPTISSSSTPQQLQQPMYRKPIHFVSPPNLRRYSGTLATNDTSGSEISFSRVPNTTPPPSLIPAVPILFTGSKSPPASSSSTLVSISNNSSIQMLNNHSSSGAMTPDKISLSMTSQVSVTAPSMCSGCGGSNGSSNTTNASTTATASSLVSSTSPAASSTPLPPMTPTSGSASSLRASPLSQQQQPNTPQRRFSLRSGMPTPPRPPNRRLIPPLPLSVTTNTTMQVELPTVPPAIATTPSPPPATTIPSSFATIRMTDGNNTHHVTVGPVMLSNQVRVFAGDTVPLSLPSSSSFSSSPSSSILAVSAALAASLSSSSTNATHPTVGAMLVHSNASMTSSTSSSDVRVAVPDSPRSAPPCASVMRRLQEYDTMSSSTTGSSGMMLSPSPSRSSPRRSHHHHHHQEPQQASRSSSNGTQSVPHSGAMTNVSSKGDGCSAPSIRPSGTDYTSIGAYLCSTRSSNNSASHDTAARMNESQSRNDSSMSVASLGSSRSDGNNTLPPSSSASLPSPSPSLVVPSLSSSSSNVALPSVHHYPLPLPSPSSTPMPHMRYVPAPVPLPHIAPNSSGGDTVSPPSRRSSLSANSSSSIGTVRRDRSDGGEGGDGDGAQLPLIPQTPNATPSSLAGRSNLLHSEPMTPVSMSSMLTPPSTTSMGSPMSPLGIADEGLRVLVAEDNILNQKVFQRLLARMNHRVTMVGNGQEALDKFIADPTAFDVIVMDVHMPIMDGLTATRLIRQIEDPILRHQSSSSSSTPMSDSSSGGKKSQPLSSIPSSVANDIMSSSSGGTAGCGSGSGISGPSLSSSSSPISRTRRIGYASAMMGTPIPQAARRLFNDAYHNPLSVPSSSSKQAPSTAPQATRTIRPYVRIPILAATAGALEEEQKECIQAGMDDVITKPIDRTQLQRKLAKYPSRAPAALALAHSPLAPAPPPMISNISGSSHALLSSAPTPLAQSSSLAPSSISSSSPTPTPTAASSLSSSVIPSSMATPTELASSPRSRSANVASNIVAALL